MSLNIAIKRPVGIEVYKFFPRQSQSWENCGTLECFCVAKIWVNEPARRSNRLICCSFLPKTCRDYILVQRCRRQKCKVKSDFGRVGTPSTLNVFEDSPSFCFFFLKRRWGTFSNSIIYKLVIYFILYETKTFRNFNCDY